jgi:hypothetical protein
MVLYPPFIRIQRDKEHVHQNSYEEMTSKLLLIQKILNNITHLIDNHHHITCPIGRTFTSLYYMTFVSSQQDYKPISDQVEQLEAICVHI